jgi:outer membrane biosynthesis protein TonB
MTVPAAKRTAVRQAIASLLRLAHDDERDARTLAEAGGTRNAASLLHSAISRLIEAVVASEQGYAGPPEIRRIDTRNPLKPSLLQLDAFLETPSALQRDGRLAAPPSAASLREPLDLFTETLARFVQHVGVDLDGSGPADTADPLRPTVEAPPPPPPAPAPAPRRAEPVQRPAPKGRPAQRKPRSRAAATSSQPAQSPPEQPAAAPAAAPKSAARAPRAGLSSGTFWSLVDHWQLPDLEALRLIGHAGGLTQKGTRPRFKLSDSEAEVVAAMHALDATLAQLGLDPATWLSVPLRPDPFRGAAPRDIIRKGRLQGLRDVSRYLTQMSLRLSLQQG